MKEAMKEIIKKLDKKYWVCYRYIRDNIFEPVWYRFFGYKHHIVKTKLTPAAWYDADTRMLYAVMEIVRWYVDNDMRIVTKRQFESEIKRIKKETSKKYQKDEIESWTAQYEEDLEIIGIAKWWKNYPKRCEQIDKTLSDWSDYNKKLCDKYNIGGILGIINNKEKITKQERAKLDRLFNEHSEKEDKLEAEEQEYLKKAIDLRRRMWS